MNFKCENEILVLFPEGRINSVNAPEKEAEIFGIISENPHSSVVLDAEKLEYISSAGLRIVLKIRKGEPDFKVINASSELYEIFDMTGFTEMITVEKAFRRMSVEGCEIIGKGAKGTVYRYNGDTIIKVYKNADSLPDIKKERELARRAFILGIPTAISYDIVRVGESYGSVFELLNAKSYSELISEDEANRDRYIAEYAALLRKIHGTAVKAEDMPDIKPFILNWLDVASPYISPAAGAKVRALIEAVPERLTMLHCDYHTNNVMSQNGETLLIDMDTLSHGHPVFELANVYITYVGFGETDPSNVEGFLGMPFAVSEYVWKKFLPAYLGTEDEETLKSVEDKAKLVSSVRAIRHLARRGAAETQKGRDAIAVYANDIEKLVETVDTLEF